MIFFVLPFFLFFFLLLLLGATLDHMDDRQEEILPSTFVPEVLAALQLGPLEVLVQRPEQPWVQLLVDLLHPTQEHLRKDIRRLLEDYLVFYSRTGRVSQDEAFGFLVIASELSDELFLTFLGAHPPFKVLGVGIDVFVVFIFFLSC